MAYERRQIEFPGYFSIRPIDVINVFRFAPLSASKIERFVACPHCFYESRRKKVKAKTDASLVGECLHDLASRITHPLKSKGLNIQKPSELLEFMAGDWSGKLLEDADKQPVKQNKYKDIHNFLKQQKAGDNNQQRIAKSALRLQLMMQQDPGQYPYVEHSFSFFISSGQTHWQEFKDGLTVNSAPIPTEVTMIGQIDQVASIGAQTEVRDLKFGVSNFRNEYAFQLGVYALAALPLDLARNTKPADIAQGINFPGTAIWDLEKGTVYKINFPDPLISSTVISEIAFWTKMAKEARYRGLETDHNHIKIKGVNYVMPGIWEETDLKNEEIKAEVNGALIEAGECFKRAKYFWNLYQKMYEVEVIPGNPDMENEINSMLKERERLKSWR